MSYNMISEEDAKFTVVDEEGKSIEYEILFTFDGETGTHYIVYTDNSLGEDG